MSSLEDAAAWLKEYVGVGGVFTKEELRAAFPNVTQIDRRVRDLRACGWVIDTHREDPVLSPAEMRLVNIGELTRSADQIPLKVRRKALQLAAYSCVLCGAAGGSAYADAQHVRVMLQVVPVHDSAMLVVCCSRCRADVMEVDIEQNSQLSSSVASAANLSAVEWAAACRARLARRIG